MLSLRWREHDNKIPAMFAAPIRISNDEFILATKARGISKYNIISKKWRHKYIAYPKQYRVLMDPICAYNKKNHILYLYDGYKSGIILKINVITKQIHIIKNKLSTLKNAKLIYIHKQLHVIGGRNNNKHLIFNESQQVFNHCHTFDSFTDTGFTNFGLINLSRYNKMLIVGGQSNGQCSSIYSYHTKNTQWTASIISTSEIQQICLYNNQKSTIYDIIGWMLWFNQIGDIYVIEVNNYHQHYKLIKSQIKCPKFSEDFHAITMTNEVKDEMVAFAYIRHVWKTEDIEIKKLISFLPHYLIKYISTWYLNEYLHLFETNADPASHWSIHIDCLFMNS